MKFVDENLIKEQVKPFDVKDYETKRGPISKDTDSPQTPNRGSPTEGLVKEIKNEFKNFQEEIKFKDLEDAGILFQSNQK